MSSIKSSKLPTSAKAGQALIKAPIGPWFRPWATLAPMVATMPMARLHLARGGKEWCRRLASSTTMLAAQIKLSTVNGRRWAVMPVSPWDVTVRRRAGAR